MKTLTELTDTTALATWIPTEQFADLILDGVVCYGHLAGKVTALEYDLQAGQGDTVNIRAIAARTAQSITDACGCLTATSSTFSEYTIDVGKLGDYDLMCGISIWQAKGNVKSAVLYEMSKGLAHAQDAALWTAMTNGAWSYTALTTVSCNSTSTTSAFCCAFAFNLFNSIVSIKQQMKGACYEPDTVVLSPTVAKWLYYKDYTYPMGGMVKFNDKGDLIEIDGLNVIETGSATACSGSKVTLAVILDSRRALGEVYGKRPAFSEFYENNCDRYREVVWMYWGCGRLDPAAKGRVMNP